MIARFDYGAAIERAERALAAPPPFGWIQRPTPRGVRVAVFALPLGVLESTNRTRRAPDWVFAKKREEILIRLLSQCDERRLTPLSGRPQVFCTRFSPKSPDRYANTFKAAVDALCVPGGRRRAGLCFLSDDRPECIDEVQWWEPAKRGQGFGLIQIFTGERKERRTA